MKYHCILTLLLTAVLALTAIRVNAVPARYALQTLIQEDGTSIQVTLAGDEHLHYYLMQDRTILVKEKTGRLCYAVIDENGLSSSGLLAHEKNRRSRHEQQLAERQRQGSLLLRNHHQARRAAAVGSESDQQPRRVNNTGTIKVPVILVQYKDLSFAIDQPRETITRQLNEHGYSEEGSVGSARDYFENQSMGQFSPVFDVFGPYTLSQDMAYYGGNNEQGNDSNVRAMILEACNLADADVRFKDYDNDGDGMVDFLYVIYAGWGEASHSGSEDAVWPHRSRLASGKESRHDGVMVYDYACSNERLGSEEVRRDGIGTLCHEFSHMLGLPDTYDVNYENAPDMGPWSLMSSGCYNGDGYIPCDYTAYEREQVGWYQIRTLEKDTALQLRPLSDGGQAYKIVNDYNSNEFIVIENIQQKGWNKAAYGHGMLAVHVNYQTAAWSSNQVNVSAKQRMVCIPADNDLFSGYAGDPYPGTTGNSELSDYSVPAALFHTGGLAHKPLTDIVERDSVIYLNVLKGSESATTALAADKVNAYSITARWRRQNGVSSYLVELFLIEGTEVAADKADASLITTNGRLLQSAETKEYNYLFDNLEAGHLYAYRVRCLSKGVWSAYSNCIFVQTTNETVDLKAPQLSLSLNDEVPGSMTANWARTDATEYRIEVLRKKDLPTEVVEDGSTLLDEDFDNIKNDYGDITKVLDLFTATPGWRCSNITAANGSVQVGSKTERGYLSTPILPRHTGSITVYFSVKKTEASDKDCKLSVLFATDASDLYYIGGGTATISDTDWKNWYIVLGPMDTNSYVSFITDGDDNKRCLVDNIEVAWGDFSEEDAPAGYQAMRFAPTDGQKADSAVVTSDYSYFATQDTFMVFKDLESAAYTLRVRSVKDGVFSPYSEPQVLGVGAQPFKSGDLYYGFMSYENRLVKVIPGRDSVNCQGDIIIPDSVEYMGHHYQVVAIDDEAFKGCDGLRSVTVNANIVNAGKYLFKGCNDLCYVYWNAPAAIRDSCFIGANPNLLLYLGSDAEVQDQRPVLIRDGRADTLILYSRYPFYAPESFTVDYAEYGREFKQQTQIGGASGGWETLWLPFDVDSVVDFELEKPLYTFASGQEGLHYWLGEWRNNAFVEAASIKAGLPYIISFPNNPLYQSNQLCSGDIYFVAHNARIQAGQGNTSRGSEFDFVPSGKYVAATEGIYALNSYDRYQKDITEGSTFLPERLWVRTFYAYMVPTSAQAPRRLPIGRLEESGENVAPLREVSFYYRDSEPYVHISSTDEDWRLQTNIYSLDGRIVGQISLHEGDNLLPALPTGLYYMLNQIIRIK
ncbi:MAG: M6 family metalloprotease domain-containing protein [Bacteroidales bacterium]|nr:M6 family metalloprotease domain-containing protein [Bacteroidales bacterium]